MRADLAADLTALPAAFAAALVLPDLAWVFALPAALVAVFLCRVAAAFLADAERAAFFCWAI